MLQDKKAVIFDLDGTLIDSMWMWKNIDEEYLARFGISCPEKLQEQIEGMSFSETADYFKYRFQIPDSVEKIKRDWNDMAYQKYKEEVTLKTGAREFLTYLKQKKIPAGIATSNSMELAEVVLDSLAIRDYFAEVHTACEVEKGKPAPDIYLLVADRLAVEPARCLVFEDVYQGIMAGRAAGMEVCAVYDPFSRMEDKKKILADYYITDFTEIEDKE